VAEKIAIRKLLRKNEKTNILSFMTQLEALQEAIRRAGGQGKLAGLIDYSQSRISQWVTLGKADVKACPAIEKATGITCTQLRPDFFTSIPKPRRQSRKKRA
jgi:DNA-binding transcriptional regulator YdaS (Cro superfamily)